MHVTVRFFASLRESTGTGQTIVEVPEGATLQALIAQLLERYPGLHGHEAAWHFAINQAHAEPDSALRDGDRVAIFPYVAGG